MAKKRSAWLVLFTVIAIFALCLTALTGCKDDENKPGKNETYTVTFMVKNLETGKYEQYKQVETDENGTIEMPKDPEIKGYSFRAWYKDEACTEGNIFDGKNVTADMTVYAFMSDKVLTISVKDEAGNVSELKEQTVSSLESVANTEAEKAAAKNLVFRGWYTNADCTTPYDNESGATTVYGRYMAKVTFNNGYEDLTLNEKGEKEIYVVPGELVTKPDAQKIKKDYMDDEDIYFVDNNDNLKDFNFKNKINENTVVRVLWKTRGLTFLPIEGTNDYTMNGFDRVNNGWASENDLVVSIPNRITVNNQEVRVVAAQLSSVVTAAPKAKTVIINDGIEYVTNLNGNQGKAAIENVYLPKTLKIIENSFNDTDNIKAINIPDGTEVILDCFWENYELVGNRERDKGYDFEILIPASVNNISLMPMNVKFAEGSDFFIEDGFIMKNDENLGKVVVSVTKANVDDTKTVTIPEGVTAIQVGVLYELKYDYLRLPKSFSKVSYNNDRADYPYYTGQRLLVADAIAQPDVDPSGRDFNHYGYAIVDDISNHTLIIFDNAAYPEGMNKYAFCDRQDAYDATDKVRFAAEIPEGEPVKITVNYANKMAGDSPKEIIIDTVLSGTTITLDKLITDAGITVNDVIKVKSVTEYAKEFDFTKPVTKNLYLDIELFFDVEGFNVKENEDGTLTVIGFNKDTAYLLENGISYLVTIPEVYNGKTIVAIADDAFAGCNDLGQIFIPATVKTIGKNAFRGTKNLELVSIAKGGLEVIGEGAFAGAGAVEVDYVGTAYKDLGIKKVWAINPEFKAAGIHLTIKLPLSNLKEIGPRAFDTPALNQFTVAAGEETRPVFQASFAFTNAYENYNVGEFYFQQTTSGFGANVRNFAIFKMGDHTPTTIGEGADARTVYDYEIHAVAAGLDAGVIAFGANQMSMHGEYFYRATIKTGAVTLYNMGAKGIYFGYVKNLEKGAFAYIDEAFITPDEAGQNLIKTVGYVDIATVQAQQSVTGENFTNGWFMGKDNADNAFMKNAVGDTGGIPGMIY